MRLCLGSRIVQNPDPALWCPPEISNNIVAVPVRFVTFAGNIDKGVMEIHRELATDVEALFWFMLKDRFPLTSVQPIARFEWDDARLMAANNTAGFNYRFIAGTERLSMHAFGCAFDINPRLNPCISGGGIIQPANAIYDPSRPGTLTADSRVVRFLKELGWTWGGDWQSPKDYQHFQKPILATSPSRHSRRTFLI